MFTFMQTGDFHLDYPWQGPIGSEEGLRLEATFLSRLLQGVKNTACDFLLITGDVFHGDHLFKVSLNRFKETLAAMAVPVLISPGNHDYIGRSDLWLDSAWPSNVHIFQDFESLYFPQWNLVVHGLGFRSQNEPISLLPDHRLDAGKFNLLMMHGDVVASSAYNPVPLNKLLDYDYVALGHRHHEEVLCQDPPVVYAGSPFSRTFSEGGDKACMLVRVQEGIHMESYPLDLPGFYHQSIRLDDYENEEDLAEALEKASPRKDSYYRWTLRGRRPAWFQPQVFFSGWPANHEFIDETRSAYDFEALAQEEDLAGLFTRKLVVASRQDPIARRALELGLDALGRGSGS